MCLLDYVVHPDSYYIPLFRLLFTSDGDGINHVLALRGDSSGDIITQVLLIVIVFGFCICILNLFIAVHGESDDKAQDNASSTATPDK